MNLRLDVSDGKDTKYVDVPLRKDVVNEAKLKKSSEKIAIFSYPRANDGVIEVSNAGDNVFLYLGESKDSPAKFVIDTDVDLDSDLNGESADDADNKGTESYSSGAPFAIKNLEKGHKNRTVRITTYDASGKKIETKDVNIVVAFLKDEAISASGSEAKTPEGISDGDKANLEKLKDIIRTKAPEQDRLKLMNQLSSLQENWFDQREKTRVILDMETVISELKLDQGIKDEAYSLLEGFLVADSQTKDEIGLAVKVLKSLIPESNAHYKEIVGESGKPGLVDEILSHPTNTVLNKELGKKILDYVKDDKNIENKDKLIIKSQLGVIIYGGQANVPESSEETASDDSSSGFVSFVLGVGKALGIIIGLLFAAVIGLFLFFKVSNRNPSLGFQDFIIEKLFGGGSAPEKKPAPAPAPVAPKASETKPADPLASMAPSKSESAPAPTVPVADPLANAFAPTAAMAPSTESFVPAADAEVALPAWLKGSSLDPLPPAETASQEESKFETSIEPEVVQSTKESVDVAPSTSNDLPDWLKGMDQSTDNASKTVAEEVTLPEPEIATPALAESTEAHSEDVSVAASVTEELKIEETSEAPEKPSSDDLPDWLKSMDSVAIEKEVAEELAPVKDAVADVESPAFQEIAESAPASDDLPDWLKSSVSLPVQEVAESAPVADVEPKASDEPAVEKKPKRAPKKAAEESAPATQVAPASDDLPEWLKP